LQTVRLRTGGDFFWQSFQLCRIRLAYLTTLRNSYKEPWKQQEFECFFLQCRLLIEQICLFLRDIAIDRMSLSRKSAKSFTPKDILDKDAIDFIKMFRIIPLTKFKVHKIDDTEMKIEVNWEKPFTIDFKRIELLYGLTNNFLHENAKCINESLAIRTFGDLYKFISEFTPIFDRHLLERCDESAEWPPKWEGFELIIGRNDVTGEDEFFGDYVLVWTKAVCYIMAHGHQRHHRHRPLPHRRSRRSGRARQSALAERRTVPALRRRQEGL